MLNQVIRGFRGDATDAMNLKLYGDVHPNVTRFVESRFEQPMDMMSDQERMFHMAAREAYLSSVSEEAMEFERRTINTLQTDQVFGDKRVVRLSSLYEFRRAGPTMANWTMVNPVLRHEWLQNRLDGYSTLIDQEAIPKQDLVSGEAHYDYRRVMSGIVTSAGDVTNPDSELSWGWTEYMDRPRADDLPLSVAAVFDILDTWASAEALLDEGVDPTNIIE